MKLYLSLLVALLSTASVGLAQAPRAATITGEIRDPTSREITFSYQPPSALGSAEERVVLDSLNRFACELPIIRGALGWAYYDEGRSIFFIEPGDSLHVVVEGGTYSFSGPNADNSRFIAEFIPRFSTPLDYEDLEVEDFKRQIDQRRRDEFEFLAEWREKYTLSPGFIDYATAFFNYEWAEFMISYPMDYRRANGYKNRNIPRSTTTFSKKSPWWTKNP